MLDMLWQQILALPPLEVLAMIVSLCYVHFAAKQHIACWPFALCSTGLYTWLFWETNLFFQSLLNGWYLIMAVYGWFNWKNMEDDDKGVQNWSVKSNLIVTSVLLLVTVLSYQLISAFVEQKILFLDLAIAIFSAFVTYMLAQKVLENWLYWIVINSFTVWLCFQQGLILTAVLFILYVAYAIKGYVSWRREIISEALTETQ